ncbi:50S ribosomal protein L32 [candidate division KSB1 bacterium]|nr:50S ribosomal protein L32 [candidate division KSB1 bacterium]RQW06863.1 MAG: 50S ribosomal protein L32 [candidate division KSB1 bacterium]
MALPKRRHSRSRQAKRRANWKASTPTVVECSNCHQPKLPHRACPNCGYYKGRSIFLPRES